MKKIILFLLALVVFASCNPEEPIAEKIKIDPLATVDIKPDPKGWGNLRSTNPEHLSPLEIVEKTTVMQYYNPELLISLGSDPESPIERGFDVLQRDLNPDNPKLKMWATDIITEDGEYMAEFIESKDIILLKFDLKVVDAPRDTIGYIPNATMRTAESAIKNAFNNNDVDAIYQLFNEAFTFRPITGAEYKTLKEAGNQ
jgi:hypothetical protein